MASNDHNDHPDRQDQHIGVLLNEVVDVARKQQSTIGEHLKQDDNYRERSENSILAQINLQLG